MKKIIIMVMILLVTTGCSKKLTCTKTEKNEFLTTKETVLIDYKNDKVSSIQIDLKATVDKKYDDYTQTIGKNLRKSFAEYEDMDGVAISSSNSDNIANVHLFMKIAAMKEEDRKKLNFIDLKENYGTVKKKMEQKKYRCS